MEWRDRHVARTPSGPSAHCGAVLQEAGPFGEERRLGEVLFGPVDVVLTQHRSVQPEVLFISELRRDIIQKQVNGVPDLAMEVISEGSWQRDRIEKKTLYQQFGVTKYWIVDPDSCTIEVFVLGEGGYELHSEGSVTQSARSKRCLVLRFLSRS